MRTIFTIAEREFRSLVTAPLGYVVMTFFLFVSGIFFIAPLQANIANIRYVVGNTTIWLVFLLPALTMRLLAEEKKQGTIELLMTSPVTETQVVLGKYLGVLAYYALMLFSTAQFLFVLGMVRKSDANPIFPTYTGLALSAATLVTLTYAALQESRPLALISALFGAGTLVCAGFAAVQMGEWGPAVTGYLGLFLLGAVFLAIGLLASGLTKNQIIAWVSTAAVLLLLTVLISWLTRDIPATAPVLAAGPNTGDYFNFVGEWIKFGFMHILQAMSLQSTLENFAQGVLDIRDFILYASLIGASLFFAVRGLTTSRAA
ncbi:MAG: ABC-type transport system involved in multi-copper enzyme maturation, permease component [Armatimonadetes bacterium]|jgi:ABC-2 type transport system permease protein|nr:ABC-type transport system involved in multi-copper enzyme maturation, permease component [Armatimonadota bacterium]